ncbi:hypothetical protein LPC08_14655 [Roseomonas sp. OT10]|uniref:hypothetical protein n=1 Tax=Roseomonas cutis TaxID=2897332 RepID=UPI001E406C17|nr:hypothetical protein [Roseomonas sp. OT10]UFN47267.1 hypothetical protein LPC08_14655 [Roseomonas sp. OT10]
MDARSQAGVLNDPRCLAGAAAGFACAAVSLWAFRGMPLGTLAFWLASLPVYLAGLSFGPVAGGLAAAVGGIALLPVAGLRGSVVFLLSAGLPAALILLAALRPGRTDLSVPLALLGLGPAVAAWASIAVSPAGLEAALATQLAGMLAASGLEVSAEAVGGLVRLAIALAGASLALPLLLCGTAAQRWLARRRLALRPMPAWKTARLPGWYAGLLALALLAAWLTGALEALTVAAALLVPVFLQGLAVIHGRLRGPVLVLFYLLLVLFSLPAATLVVGLGLLEQFGRKPPRT